MKVSPFRKVLGDYLSYFWPECGFEDLPGVRDTAPAPKHLSVLRGLTPGQLDALGPFSEVAVAARRSEGTGFVERLWI